MFIYIQLVGTNLYNSDKLRYNDRPWKEREKVMQGIEKHKKDQKGKKQERKEKYQQYRPEETIKTKVLKSESKI